MRQNESTDLGYLAPDVGNGRMFSAFSRIDDRWAWGAQSTVSVNSVADSWLVPSSFYYLGSGGSVNALLICVSLDHI